MSELKDYANFTDKLKMEYAGGGGFYKLLKSFTFWTDGPKKGIPIHVPYGLISDLASVPFLARLIIPKSGDYAQSAFLHDQLYANQGYIFDPRAPVDIKTEWRKKWWGGIHPKQTITGRPIYRFTRKESDEIFLNSMEVIDAWTNYNIPKWKREVMYRAVRLNFFANWKLSSEDYALREKLPEALKGDS